MHRRTQYSGGSYKRHRDAKAQAERLTSHFSDKNRRYWVRRTRNPNYPYKVVGTTTKARSRLGRLRQKVKPRRITRQDVKAGAKTVGGIIKRQVRKQIPKKKSSLKKRLKKALR